MAPKVKTIKRAPKGTPKPLKEYSRILETIKKDPKYKNKTYHELQKIASKLYQKM